MQRGGVRVGGPHRAADRAADTGASSAQRQTGKDRFSAEAIALWERLAGYLAIALAKVEAEEALRCAHDELEERVRERTDELEQAYNRLIEEGRVRQQVEGQLRQAQKMDALGTLTGGVAHDFNNILAAILGFTDVVRGHLPEGSRDARSLDRVMDAGIRGRDLIKQMLAFGRKSDLVKKPLLVSSIVKETMKLLRASIPTTITIEVDVEDDEGMILGDPVQMQQVLMNLSTNAAYAMREKGGQLNVELRGFTATENNPDGLIAGDYVRLTVRDTGEGIAENDIEKIFDPFFTTKKQGEGTGLGLSVVHGIVSQLEGRIVVESRPGEGSVFSVFFPRLATKAPKAAPAKRLFRPAMNASFSSTMRSLSSNWAGRYWKNSATRLSPTRAAGRHSPVSGSIRPNST